MVNNLLAISPLDGRYASKTEPLGVYFSEYALIKARLFVEIEYFKALLDFDLQELKGVNKSFSASLNQLYKDFGVKEAQEIKQIEKTTNHDVKAVEYFLKSKFDDKTMHKEKEFVHFALTSQDINNTAVPYLLKGFHQQVLIPELEKLHKTFKALSIQWKDIPMLARTHGQPASPTVLGKEIYVFAERLEGIIKGIKNWEFECKFGGATGGFNAHAIAYPEKNWIKFSDALCKNSFGLKRQKTTTQIEHYDNLALYLGHCKQLSVVLMDFCKDIWTYVSMDYFKQKTVKGEIGSSAMPHKVNPIDFENAEGNLGIAVVFLDHLSAKLPISRLQRDLTDSTVLRNLGVPFGHLSIALASIEKGLGKLELNVSKLESDLDANWAVLAEAIQTILRKEGYPNPYETLKELTRGKKNIGSKEIKAFIQSLDIKPEIKDRLMKLSPATYIGLTFDPK